MFIKVSDRCACTFNHFQINDCMHSVPLCLSACDPVLKQTESSIHDEASSGAAQREGQEVGVTKNTKMYYTASLSAASV